MSSVELYQSVLKKLSGIPRPYLEDVDHYLSGVVNRIKRKPTNVAKIMSFAGSWSDMKQEDFDDYLAETRNTRTNLFDRSIDL